MTSEYTFVFLGGDLRQVYMANNLVKKGYSVVTYGINNPILDERCWNANSLIDALNLGNIIIGPVPVSRDKIHILALEEQKDLLISNLCKGLSSDQIFFCGDIPESVSECCNSKHVFSYDLMKDANIAILNAIATAEGTIMEAIKNSTRNLHKSNCLILGYGKCATVLAKKLSSFDVNVCISARKKENLVNAQCFGYNSIPLTSLKDHISEYDYIFNTIPSMILTKELLANLAPDATIIDIASNPGGVDYTYAKENNINAHLCLGLPGKVASKSSADILVNAILQIIIERSDSYDSCQC